PPSSPAPANRSACTPAETPPSHAPGPRLLGPSPKLLGPNLRLLGPSPKLLGPNLRLLGPSLRLLGPSLRLLGPSLRLLGPSLRLLGPSSLGLESWTRNPSRRSWVSDLIPAACASAELRSSSTAMLPSLRRLPSARAQRASPADRRTHPRACEATQDEPQQAS